MRRLRELLQSAAATGEPDWTGFWPGVVRGIQDRRDGTYYSRVLHGALASAPQWAVVISTWNEWLEDTQIEPSVEYGDLYLRLTREFAETFKGGMLAAPPCC